jgi:CheY-like chemotaxis protein
VELLAGGIARVFDNLLAQSREELALARRKIGAPEEAHVHLGEVERILGSAGELTGRLLTFATGGRPTKTQLSLSPLIEQIAGEAADAADISWRLETADGLWPVEADEDQLRLVIRCFIDQFRERATDTLTLNLRLSNEKIAAGKKPPLPAGLYVHLLLHGPDQPPAMHLRSKMLEPDDLMRELGAELQLAIAHSIIHMHGGLVTVEAHPVVGTAYDIYLPARTPRTAREAAASRTRRRVLLMDDEELVVQMTGSLLDHLGYAFASSANGEQMLEQYAAAKERGEPFDVVILDLTVTRGMGGEKAIARLLALDPQARAIVTTGYADDIIMTDYAAYGFRGCLAKPFQIKDLTRVLEEILKD